MTKEELIKLPLKGYFKQIEKNLTGVVDLESLTNLFTSQQYEEKTPYLIRRQLRPIDNRFSNIEIVYELGKPVGAIFWYFRKPLSLNQLIDCFGEPIVHNEPYSNTTAFAFRSKNPDIDVIEARCQEWITEMGNSTGGYEMEIEEERKRKIGNSEFNFIGIKLR